jgi:hypothetical protein
MEVKRLNDIYLWLYISLFLYEQYEQYEQIVKNKGNYSVHTCCSHCSHLRQAPLTLGDCRPVHSYSLIAAERHALCNKRATCRTLLEALPPMALRFLGSAGGEWEPPFEGPKLRVAAGALLHAQRD